MLRKAMCVVSIWLLAGNALLLAQGTPVPPGRWNKVQSEIPGTGLVVTLHGGEKITCFLKSLSEHTVTVITTETKEREIPKIAVQKIVTSEKRSGSLWNGAIIGAAIPVAIIGIPLAAYDGDKSGAAPLLLVTAGLGALIGVGIDAAYRGQVTLYKAKEIKNGN